MGVIDRLSRGPIREIPTSFFHFKRTINVHNRRPVWPPPGPDAVTGSDKGEGAAGVRGINTDPGGTGVAGFGGNGAFGFLGGKDPVFGLPTGVYGESKFVGVFGHAIDPSQNALLGGAGVFGLNASDGPGVTGKSTVSGAFGALGGTDPVFHQHAGVYGESDWQGVMGLTTVPGHTGVYGGGTHAAGGSQIGVRGETVTGIGVKGQSFGGNGNAMGFLSGTDPNSPHKHAGVYGESDQNGVMGLTTNSQGTGVFGGGTHAAGGSQIGVRGETTVGVGVQGQSFGSGTGVNGISQSGPGMQGSSVKSITIDSPIESAEFDSVGVQGFGPVGVRGFGNPGVLGVSDNIGVQAVGSPAILVKTNSVLGEDLIVGQSPKQLPPGVGQSPVPFENVFRVDKTGAGFFNGGTKVGGADVAEFITANQILDPGDVVEIDPDHPGRFRKAGTPISTAVAGVISSNPGVTLGARGASDTPTDNALQLALVGRVPVKVSVENGAIHPGDLLVTSSTPGRAMRAPDRLMPGTVIGKALGRLTSGKGIIDMLVMLS